MEAGRVKREKSYPIGNERLENYIHIVNPLHKKEVTKEIEMGWSASGKP